MKILKLVLLLIALVVAVACNNEDPMNQALKLSQSKRFTIQQDKKYPLLEFISNMLDNENLSDESRAQNDALYNQVVKYVDDIKQANNLGSDVDLSFRKISFLYNSTDQYANSVELSSMIYWLGYFKGEEWCDISPENITLMEHYTISSNGDAPTVGFPMEPFMLGNRLVIMPDYIGYGSTKSMVHPYLNHELCAINSLDALTAGYALFDSLAVAPMAEGWKMTAMGASQGGGNALAIHKYMDTHGSFAKEWRFDYSSCCAGPYSPLITMEHYLESGKTIYPLVFPLTLKAMLDSYPLLFGGVSEVDFFSENYLKHKDTIDKMVRSKNYISTEINEYFFQNVRTTVNDNLADDEIYLSDILSQAMFDDNSAVVKALYSALDKNDLTKGWRPKRPIKLFYSKGDRVVPYHNSIAVQQAFGYEIVTVTPFAETMSHHDACAAWMVSMVIN